MVENCVYCVLAWKGSLGDEENKKLWERELIQSKNQKQQ